MIPAYRVNSRRKMTVGYIVIMPNNVSDQLAISLIAVPVTYFMSFILPTMLHFLAFCVTFYNLVVQVAIVLHESTDFKKKGQTLKDTTSLLVDKIIANTRSVIALGVTYCKLILSMAPSSKMLPVRRSWMFWK